MDKKVTVVTATYNYGHFIKEAVESVLNQTFQDFEYIIIDDGSTDDTGQRIKKYLDRVNYIYSDNHGQYYQFNKAVTMAQGEYIAFLDSDDKWHQGFLEKSVRFLENNPAADMVFCDFSSFNDNVIFRQSTLKNIPCFRNSLHLQEFIFEECLEHLIQQDFIFPSCSLIRRSVFNNFRFESIFKGSDYDFFISVAHLYKIGVIMEVLTDKRDHQNNSSHSIFNSMGDRIGAMKRLLANPHLDPRLAHLAKERMAKAYSYWAYDEFKKKNFRYSSKLAFSSLQSFLSMKAFKTLVYSLILSLFRKGSHKQ